MGRFSDYTYECLKRAGWYEGRRVDVEPFAEQIRLQGFEIMPRVADCLAEFGGLIIKFENQSDNPLKRGSWDELRFEPRYADMEAEEYERIIGPRIAPIGDCGRHHASMIMTESGAVFSAFDDNVTLMGDTVDAAIEHSIYSPGAKKGDILVFRRRTGS
ncbi:SUKH-3 domain-containing protein [Fontivita pretiosa]|uniref:SUKH-3 domain-containing protein n=1 Tax=Fontivita pretiosa TaxID=2989684 RepID=UPI003D180461